MIIEKKGKYVLTERYSVMGSGQMQHFFPGKVFNVTLIDRNSHRFYAKEFSNWVPWEVPADEVEDQRRA
jgi:hypothetical protein